MAELIVGTEVCTIAKIVDTIMSTPGCVMLFKDWHAIATALETPGLKKQKIIQDLIVNMTTVSAALQSVLTEWRSRMANEATLGQLINIFRTKDLTQIAESLEEKFSVKKYKSGVGLVDSCNRKSAVQLPGSECNSRTRPKNMENVAYGKEVDSQCRCCCV